MQGRNKRPVLMLALILGSIILLTLTLVNRNVNISGVAIVNTSEEAENDEAPTDQPADEPTTETQQDIPQVADETVVSPEIPATSVPPTPIPPTLPEPTSLPTEIPAEMTEIPTSAPEATELPQPTGETTPEVEITPEATSESVLSPEITSEATAELEQTPEITPEATPEFNQFVVFISCTNAGVLFEVTNVIADMVEPETYLIDGVEAGQVLLAQGETNTIQSGYGTPSLSLAESDFQLENSCNPPPELAITMECTVDTGVIFVITNTGGAMASEQPYTVTQADGETLGTFQLGEEAWIEIPAGYGTPTLTTGDLQAQFDPACNAPAHVQGHIWNDTNSDGLYTEAEPEFAGVMVELVNADDFPVAVTTLDDGRYEFFPVSEGVYTLRVVIDTLPTDVQNTVDPDGIPDSQVSLAVTSGENYSLNFAYTVLATASISGNVWLETGNFGVYDAGETGLSGATVQLVDINGLTVQEMTVTADGTYHFEKLVAGTYSLQVVSTSLPQPFGVTFDADGNNDLETVVVVESEQALDSINFGIVGTF